MQSEARVLFRTHKSRKQTQGRSHRYMCVPSCAYNGGSGNSKNTSGMNALLTIQKKNKQKQR